MPARLDPAEAQRRREERARRTWSGANNQKYDPIKEGYGSAEEWAAAADAAASGRGTFRRMEGRKSEPRRSRDMVTLGLMEMPADIVGLKKAFRNAIMVAHPDHGGTAEAARNVLEAFKRLCEFY